MTYMIPDKTIRVKNASRKTILNRNADNKICWQKVHGLSHFWLATHSLLAEKKTVCGAIVIIALRQEEKQRLGVNLTPKILPQSHGTRTYQ